MRAERSFEWLSEAVDDNLSPGQVGRFDGVTGAPHARFEVAGIAEPEGVHLHLRIVRGGETVEVTDRGEPVARLVPIVAEASVLTRLVAQGRVTQPTITGPMPLPPEWGDPQRDIAAELAASREDERW